MSAWDRQTKPHPKTGKPWLEPQQSYIHFLTFRDLGPQRSPEQTAKIHGVKIGTIYAESSEWTWVERADQFDAHVRAVHDRAFLSETAKKGRQRATAWSALLGKSLECLKKYDPEKRPAKLGEIAAAMKAATDGLRLEEGLETARVSMEVQDVRIILASLPAEVRGPLVRLLDEHANAGATAGEHRALPVGSPAGDE